MNEPLPSQSHPGFLSPAPCTTWCRATWTSPLCRAAPSLSCCPPSPPMSWSTISWWSSAQQPDKKICTVTAVGPDAQRWRWRLRVRFGAGQENHPNHTFLIWLFTVSVALGSAMSCVSLGTGSISDMLTSYIEALVYITDLWPVGCCRSWQISLILQQSSK